MEELERAILYARQMENIEMGIPGQHRGADLDATEQAARDVIGYERKYSPHHIRVAQTLSAGIARTTTLTTRTMGTRTP